MNLFQIQLRYWALAVATLFSAANMCAANLPPKVGWDSPANNAKFSAPATILFKTTETDADGSVAKVEFFSGATKRGEVSARNHDSRRSSFGATPDSKMARPPTEFRWWLVGKTADSRTPLFIPS